MSKGTQIITELQARGFIHQCTDLEGLAAAIDTNAQPACYIGFDCTASSLHVGNLMQIMLLRLLQKHGVKPIILIGGATSKIGDPSDKDQMRRLMLDSEIEANIAGIQKSLTKFIEFGSNSLDAIMVNNSSWLATLNYLYHRYYAKTDNNHRG